MACSNISVVASNLRQDGLMIGNEPVKCLFVSVVLAPLLYSDLARGEFTRSALDDEHCS
jgi:hypothetical protein